MRQAKVTEGKFKRISRNKQTIMSSKTNNDEKISTQYTKDNRILKTEQHQPYKHRVDLISIPQLL